MYGKQTMAILLLLTSATAMAQTTTLKAVVVRAESAETVQVSCLDPEVSPQDVQRVLAIQDFSQTPALRKQLVKAVSAACQAGVARIQVARSSKSLTWKPADADDAG